MIIIRNPSPKALAREAVGRRERRLASAESLSPMLELDTTCPQCGQAWEVRQQLLGKRASGFASCAFRCHSCGMAYSNSSTTPAARIRITREPALNVPEQVRDGLDAALDGAATVGNRPSKRQKFCSYNSEDAVSWTVVHGLLQAGRVGALVGDLGLGAPGAVLTWGHPIAGDGVDLAARLTEVSDQLGEHPPWRSEPDIILHWPNVLVVIEAKHGSANDAQPNHPAYSTYLKRLELFAPGAAVAEERSYQLTRNWVIGTELAEDLNVPLLLVNLGPAETSESAASFAALLAQTPGRSFAHRTWAGVLADATPLPPWLEAYAAEHGLISA